MEQADGTPGFWLVFIVFNLFFLYAYVLHRLDLRGKSKEELKTIRDELNEDSWLG
jgi:hypothetical protein